MDSPSTSSPRDSDSLLERALAFLSTFTDYEQKGPAALKREALDLRRMNALTKNLAMPHLDFPVVHIAGSKGKGSTTLMLDSLLRCQGLRTGRFLSPHVMKVTERIAINGSDISAPRFYGLSERLRPLVDELLVECPRLLPSFFESITLMSFLAFQQEEVDVAVMETGLGGRLDATNVVSPVVTIITMIDLEHTRVLGSTTTAIAREKAGIIKPGCPLICGEPRHTPAGQVIESVAQQRHAPVLWLHEDILIRQRANAREDTVFSVQVRDRVVHDLQLPFPGSHQRENLALAIAATALLADQGLVPFDRGGIAHSIATLALPARQEYFAADAVHLPCPLLLDSAHTPASMGALAATLKQHFPQRPCVLLLGLLRDKDPRACLEPLRGLFDHILIKEPLSPRALGADELSACLRPLCDEQVTISTIGSLEELPDHLSPEPALLVVTGSVYLAGEVRRQTVVDCAGKE